ncbi:hypothetical protein [Segatella oulorum]|uniref:hypothetical protein n=1 Tax=Segatella oulorum TaxID=28136 RepID=UPI001181011C|nr:hypothetical protein [Segatella oulorum]
MDAPLQGDTVGHAGTDPTSLHQTLLPRNLPRFSPSMNTSPPTIPRVCPSAEPLPTACNKVWWPT